MYDCAWKRVDIAGASDLFRYCREKNLFVAVGDGTGLCLVDIILQLIVECAAMKHRLVRHIVDWRLRLKAYCGCNVVNGLCLSIGDPVC